MADSKCVGTEGRGMYVLFKSMLFEYIESVKGKNYLDAGTFYGKDSFESFLLASIGKRSDFEASKVQVRPAQEITKIEKILEDAIYRALFKAARDDGIIDWSFSDTIADRNRRIQHIIDDPDSKKNSPNIFWLLRKRCK